MQRKELKKIVFTDGENDKAITGEIIKEDDFFITLITRDGKRYEIGKRAIILIKDWSEQQ